MGPLYPTRCPSSTRAIRAPPIIGRGRREMQRARWGPSSRARHPKQRCLSRTISLLPSTGGDCSLSSLPQALPCSPPRASLTARDQPRLPGTQTVPASRGARKLKRKEIERYAVRARRPEPWILRTPGSARNAHFCPQMRSRSSPPRPRARGSRP